MFTHLDLSLRPSPHPLRLGDHESVLCIHECFTGGFICVTFQIPHVSNTVSESFVFLFPAYFTECDDFWLHPCRCKWHYAILLYG